MNKTTQFTDFKFRCDLTNESIPVNFSFLTFFFFFFKLGEEKEVRGLKPNWRARWEVLPRSPTCPVPYALPEAVVWLLSWAGWLPEPLLLVFGKTISFLGFPLGLGVLILSWAAKQNFGSERFWSFQAAFGNLSPGAIFYSFEFFK